MAKKWKDDEILEYIGTKTSGITQKNYEAPQVITNFESSTPSQLASTVSAFNSVEPTVKMTNKEISAYIASKNKNRDNYVAPTIETNFTPNIGNITPTVETTANNLNNNSTYYTKNGQLYRQDLVSSNVNGEKDTYTYKNTPITDELEKQSILNNKDIVVKNKDEKKQKTKATKDNPYYYTLNGKLYKEELVESKENGKKDTYTYKNTLVDNIVDEYFIKNDPSINIEDRGTDILRELRDGYQFGDALKTFNTIMDTKVVQPAANVVEEFKKNPYKTSQAFATSTIAGIDESENKVGTFLNEITGNKKEEQEPYSVVGMNVSDFNRISKKSDEEKQLYLNQLEKDYANGKLSDYYYKLAKLALTKEDTRNSFEKWADDNMNPDYKDTPIYKEYENGELSDGLKDVWETGENLGMQLPSMALSTMFVPEAGTAYFWAQATQGYKEDALKRGYTEEEANKYGPIMGTVEAVIERLGFDELGGLQSMADDSLIKAISGEMMEEFATPWIDYGVRTYFGEDYNFDAALNEAIDGAVSAAVTSAIMSSGSKGLVKVDNVINKTNSGQQVTQQELVDAAKELQQNDPNAIKSKVDTYLSTIKESNYADVQIYNNLNQELEEVKQKDIQDTLGALNLEEETEEKKPTPNQENIQEEIEENIEEENATTPTATELELNLENQTQNQTQNNINITTGLEEYIKNNNITELTEKNIEDYINEYIEQQGTELDEQERKVLIDDYKNQIKEYAKENNIPVIESPNIEIPDMTAESKVPSKTIGRDIKNEIKRDVNRFNEAVERNQYKVGNQVKEQYKNLEDKSIRKLDNDALFFNQQEQKKNTFTQKAGNYVYVPSSNPRIDAFRRSTATYFPNNGSTQAFAKVAEKVIRDKGVNITFNPNLKENARISNKNSIEINPNSNRAAEFLLTHELTHAIGNKQMLKMIETYRKSNPEFNSAVEKLLSTYKASEINEEALADISGQLFGNQEFINNLSMEKPSLFKRLYNEIKYMWHQFRGYKNQNEFIDDLYNKWTTAYRKNIANKEATKSSKVEMSNQVDNKGNKLSKWQEKYFKDSKVRDDNGNLKTMYHGTKDNFTVFENKGNKYDSGFMGKGYYFVDNQELAKDYSKWKQGNYGDEKVMEEYLNITNPLDLGQIKTSNKQAVADALGVDIDTRDITKITPEESQKITDALKEKGYDGVIWQFDGDTQAMVLNSNQIKNVDNLEPTTKDDIRYSKEAILDIKEKNKVSVEDDMMPRFMKMFHSAFDKFGNLKSFKQQVKDFENNKLSSGEQLLVMPNTKDLQFANINDAPVVTSQTDLQKDLIGKHSTEVPRKVIDNLPNELKNSVLAMDSRTQSNAKVFILETKNDKGIPIIATIHQNRNNSKVELNALTSVYEKNDLQSFINRTINDNLNVYTNKKTNDWLTREGLQLPDRYANNSLVSGNNISQESENVKHSKNNEEWASYLETSFKDKPLTKSNTGKNLSKGQQEYFKDSKIRDNKGELITVYHTTTEAMHQFNEFNPVGTDYYRFGDQVVNYYTNSKDMSGSYANQDYVMADTTKLNNIEEANQYLKEKLEELNKYRKEWGDRELRIELARNDAINKHKPFSFVTEEKNPNTGEWFETDVDSFETLEKALKNANRIIQRRSPAQKRQYEGYINITNPYIVDAEERNWNQVVSQSNDFIDMLDERLSQDSKNNLTRLYQESANKSNEAREEFNVLENAIRGMWNSAVDEDIKKVSEVIKRVGYNEIEDALNYDGKMGIMGVRGWYNIASALKEEGIIGDSTSNLIIDNFELPNDIKSYLKENYDKQIPIYKLWTTDASKLMNQLGANTTLKDLYSKNQEKYLEFDKYRYPQTYFKEKYAEENSMYTDLDLEDMLDTRAATMGIDAVMDEIAEAASVGFSKPELIRLWGTSKTTNDVVKEIIASNKDGSTNYDGVIIKNVYDYGGRTDTKKSANDLYVTFNSNQFKNIDNTNPTADPDIRYSKDNSTWREYLEKEFPAQGTTTSFNDMLGKETKKTNNTTPEVKTPQNEASNKATKGSLEYETMQKYVDTGRDTDFVDYHQLENGNIIARAKDGTYSVIDGNKVIVDGQKIPTDGLYMQTNSSMKRDLLDLKDSDFIDVKYSTEEVTDSQGKKVKLKQTSNNTYEQVNTPKPKKTDTIVDMSVKTANLGDKQVSNFYSNITEKSKFITEENRESLKDNENLKYYDAITNKETLENAMDKLNSNAEDQVGEFFTKDKFTAEDVATGWILIKRYQDAGNYDGMTRVIERMREKGTEAGQAIQMYGMLQRLTPEGMEYYAQKQLDEAYDKFTKNKSKKQIEKYAQDFTLTAEEHQFIQDQMKKVEEATDDDTKKVEIAKIVRMLSDKLPPESGQRIKAWMRISMLGNPKTQVRNIMGNAIIQPVNWVGDIVATATDKAIAKKTGTRTIGNTDFGALTGGFLKGGKEAIRDAKLGIDTRDINLNRFEENIGAKPFYEGHKGTGGKILNAGAKVLNKTNEIVGNVMSGGDRIFYQSIYDNSLKNQMKLNGVETPTQEMMNIAEQEALSRTWNDSNEYTKAVLQIRNAMNKLNVKGYGLGDVLVPFAKTPANLTKAIVDYSPAGLVRTILQDGKNLKNSLENGQYNAQLQHKFADSLGKGFAGSLLYIAAYALAKAGIITGASDDDKDVSNFMRNTLGIQPYSIKIGDKSFTYDWAQPIAAPFAIMADAVRLSEKDNQDFESIVKTGINSASNILLEQSFLSSIQDVFNNYNGPAAAIQEQIEGLPARATPTFFKQVADLIDPKKRQTYVKGNEKEYIKNQVISKIPGATYSLETQKDTLGRDIEKYGGNDNPLQYTFNVFLNPANTQKGEKSEAAEEIYAVYSATGDKTVMPRQVGYSESVNGQTRNLTAKERNEWQEKSGQLVEENVSGLKNNKKYQAMSDEDKADVIQSIVNYSFNKAKSEVFDTNISTQYKTAAKKEAEGIAIYDYYVDRVSKRK